MKFESLIYFIHFLFISYTYLFHTFYTLIYLTQIQKTFNERNIQSLHTNILKGNNLQEIHKVQRQQQKIAI